MPSDDQSRSAADVLRSEREAQRTRRYPSVRWEAFDRMYDLRKARIKADHLRRTENFARMVRA